ALTHLKQGRETRILGAGCGTAAYALTLAVMGYTVEAFDYNEGALAFAHRLEDIARQIKPDLHIELFQDNLLDIHADSNTYDLVFNQAVLDYFCDPAERRKALAEMVRVAKPGGWVAVIVQHTGHPFRGWWERLGWQGYTNQPPTAKQTPDMLERELGEAGLMQVVSDGLYPWKAFFFYPAWHRRWKPTENIVYLLGQALQRGVPLPRKASAKLSLQFLVAGQKP
ncbi:MAG TPA: class I SAM-dependent methyltransferase, partial [Anaerolineae bacterium]